MKYPHGLHRRCRYSNLAKCKICVEKMYHSASMQKKQDLRSGVILACALVTKKMRDLIPWQISTIIRNGKKIFTALSESEYFDIMEDYAMSITKLAVPYSCRTGNYYYWRIIMAKAKTRTRKNWVCRKTQKSRQGDVVTEQNTPRRLATMHVNYHRGQGR